jgi:amphi-Trp domain-containing protein
MVEQGTCMPLEEKLEFQSLEDCETIRQYLAALEQGFAKGAITLSSEGKTFVLKPQGFLSFQLTAKKKGGETKIALKISWKDSMTEKEKATIAIS